ncbi:MAG: hypothetical protein OXI16_08950 [Chloroflexota bacterium]|nr:hypothetical protein [Chloroflexota bacterium]MDE2687605.1 hypothetical protein [Chloroflexota bacterium]
MRNREAVVVILRGYARYGEDVLRETRGMTLHGRSASDDFALS